MKPLVTRAELEQVVKEYKREGAPTCLCWGCKFARRMAKRIGMKVETVAEWNARWARIEARRAAIAERDKEGRKT